MSKGLRRSFAAEIEKGQVIVYPKGVWNKDEVLKFSSDRVGLTRGSVLQQGVDGNSILVPLTTVDKIVEELKLPRVDFIKMDIEGAEKQALAGSRRTLVDHRPRMAICVYHLHEDPVEIPKLARAIVPGYQTRCQCLNYSEYIEGEVTHFYHY